MYVNGLAGQYANQLLPLDKGSLVFGRNSASCNVLFADGVRGISRIHCKVEISSGGAMITDLGSSYGTFVNGMKIQQYAPRPLNNGDTFYLGDKSNMFSFQNPNAAPIQVGAPVQVGTPVTYLEPNAPQEKASSGSKSSLIVGIAAVAVIAIVILAAYNAVSTAQQQAIQAEQRAQSAQSALEDEKNKGFVEQVIDVADAWFD